MDLAHPSVLATASSPWLPVAYIGAAVVAAIAATWGALLQRRSGKEGATAAREAADAARRSTDAAQRSADDAKRSADAARRSADAAVRSAQASEERVALAAESDRATRIRVEDEALSKRYKDASIQLGHQEPVVRLAGGYAMARLADDWEDQRQMCIDMMCAYLRLPIVDSPAANSERECEVRRAITDTIAVRLSGTRDAPTRWPGCSFDLSNARLSMARFVGCVFDGDLVVSHATFTGFNNYLNCYFGGATHFSGILIKNGTLIIDAARTRYLIEMVGAVVGHDGLLRVHHTPEGGQSRITLSGSTVQSGGCLVIRLPNDLSGNSLRVEGLKLARGSTVVLEPQGNPGLADPRLVAGQLRTWIVEHGARVQVPFGMRLAGPGFDLHAEIHALGAQLETV